jgi:hypothetical protein
MKYKVGDKVRVRSDLKVDKGYGHYFFSYEMKEFKGKKVTIEKVLDDCYLIEESWFKWTDEMLEDYTYTYKDLKKSLVGTKITFEKGEILVKNGNDTFENAQKFRRSEDFKHMKDNYYILGKIIKVEEPTYTTVYEQKEEILDEKEKEYLSAVIKPFRSKVEFIEKIAFSKEKTFIRIGLKEEASINLPYFKDGTMYKNMKLNKKYTLEELGL